MFCLYVDRSLNGISPLPSGFWLIWHLFCFSSPSLLCTSGAACIPLFSPKTVLPKITAFCVGDKKLGAHLHCLPKQALYRLQSLHCKTSCVQLLSTIVWLFACELSQSIHGLFLNLQWRQIIWDICSQIMSLADLTPPFYQAGCCQFLASW